MNEKAWESAKQSIQIESSAVMDAWTALDRDSFEKAVDTLVRAERIITCACGSSGAAASKFSHSLCCIERPAKFMPPAEAVHGGLGCVQANDAVVLVSRGGKTSELLPIIDVVKKKQATLIAVTENTDSPLAARADILLKMKVTSESDPLNIMATASFVATIALFDALLAAIMVETDFSLNQFALIHPGGAVGKRLNN